MEFLTGVAVLWPMTRATAVRPANVISALDRLRPTNNHYIRDTNFYRKDGNCVIVVENVIFKVSLLKPYLTRVVLSERGYRSIDFYWRRTRPYSLTCSNSQTEQV